LEHANDDDRTYYLIEKESLVNKYISVPKDKGNLNCAAFSAGIIEGILNTSNFVSINFHPLLLNHKKEA
jgi:trafficking protein particle complex subunit 5